MDYNERTKRVQWIYASKDNAELSRRYDQWAKDYDVDLNEEFGWLGPQRNVDYCLRYIPKEARILDAGAGTGIVGRLLADQGYKNLVAMDLSVGMLKEAEKKSAYQEFHQMVMGEPLGFENGSFDAVVSCGVFTVGHAPAGSFDELIRITRPAGHIVFSIRPDVYRDNGFKEKVSALEAEKKWTFVEASEEFKPLPKGEPDVFNQVWVYRVL